MEGFVFPNESPGFVLWGIIIVLYPFMTCMIDGCAFVASVPFLFKNKKLKPISRLAILWSLSFLPVAFVPLLLDIGNPQRAFHIIMTPRFQSPMAVFGFIFSAVAILVILEAYLVVRPDFVRRWEETSGAARWLFAALSLGVRPVTPESRELDRKLIKVLEILALPAAIVLTGYVGFIFGTVPANPWWSSPIRPLVFLGAAVTSGFSLVTLVAVLLRPNTIPDETIRSLGKCLLGSLVTTAALSGLEVLSIAYPGGTAQHIIAELFGAGGLLYGTYFYGQMLICVGGPLVLLGGALLLGARGRTLKLAAALSGLLGVTHTAILLWNVVIGGQLVSKSLRGRILYAPPFGGHKGILATVFVALLPIVIFAILALLVPLFEKSENSSSPGAEGAQG